MKFEMRSVCVEVSMAWHVEVHAFKLLNVKSDLKGEGNLMQAVDVDLSGVEIQR